MVRLKQITIECFRSISDQIEINFPENKPVVLIEENNSGKSNFISAIELMFGEFHPKYRKLDDFEHYNRDTNNQIIINASIQGLVAKLANYGNHFSCHGLVFRTNKGKVHDFVGIQSENGAES